MVHEFSIHHDKLLENCEGVYKFEKWCIRRNSLTIFLNKTLKLISKIKDPPLSYSENERES